MKIIVNRKNNISYEIELINQKFFKRILRRTYKITQIISKCGVVQKIRKLIIIVIFAFGLQFSNLKPVKTVIQTPTEIQRQLQDAKSTQADRAMKGSKSSSIRNLLKISGGDLGKLSSPGARAQNAVRNARNNRVKGPKGGKSKSGGGFFVKAWSQKNSNRSRPIAANHFSQQWQAGQDGGENGLFGRFSPRSAPNPSNPGCSDYLSKSSQPGASLQMEKPSAMPHQESISLTKEQKRNLPDARDGQVKFKTPKHGKIHGLPTNENGKTLKTEKNALALRDSLVKMPERKGIRWFDNGGYQKGTERGYDSVNLYDKDKRVIAVYKKQENGECLFSTTCKVTPVEETNLYKSDGNYVTEAVLNDQND